MIQKYIDGQYRRPTGVVGRWIGNNMARQHRPENLWTVSLLNVQPTDRILELGFGPGVAIAEVARLLTNGQVSGIDFSRTMLSLASQRNAAAIKAGRVDLRYGDVAHLPFADNTFAKVFGIHTIYFWPKPLDALKEVRRVLKPGGLLAITIRPREAWNRNDPEVAVGTPQCTPYTGAEIADRMVEASFSSIQLKMDSDPNYASNFSVIGVK